MKLITAIIGFIFCMYLMPVSVAQISPGDLAEVHAELEGISNCTLCHILGDKVSDEKCLDCHTLLKKRIDQSRGYHASSEVTGKSCVECHNDHHGRKFEIIRFDEKQFDHKLTGYPLEGAHAEKKCIDCHKTEFIREPKIKEKKFTFLGMDTKCLACHNDYHQSTLPDDCASCHEMKAFKPAGLFDHAKTKFELKGKHKDVACEKCHPKQRRNEKEFQVFSGVKFDNCTQCHDDVHNNKFGQDCSSCHSEVSFLELKTTHKFNHNKTDYPLEGRHVGVDCNACHKTKYTDALAYNKCSNCHTDYHQGQFRKQDNSPDCSSCHDVNGFTESSFTIDRHQIGAFKLNDAHLATPCFACHKKKERWEFKSIGINCNDCHEDIHKGFIDPKYYPENNCKNCHRERFWSDIEFDHNKTNFELLGSHKEQSCRSCHFNDQGDQAPRQQFKGLSMDCLNCHKDVHHKQFEINGLTDCTRCHDFKHWTVESFDHSKTKFPLDGKHKDVACSKCHKKKTEDTIVFTLYKINNYRCKDCH